MNKAYRAGREIFGLFRVSQSYNCEEFSAQMARYFLQSPLSDLLENVGIKQDELVLSTSHWDIFPLNVPTFEGKNVLTEEGWGAAKYRDEIFIPVYVSDSVGAIVLRWKPEDDEIRLLQAGADVPEHLDLGRILRVCNLALPDER